MLTQLRARTLPVNALVKYGEKRIAALFVSPAVVAQAGEHKQVRGFATEADPKDYGYYPDPIEHAVGLEKKMMMARLAGDDRYEPKIYYRSEHSTREEPNLVPAYYDNKVIGCLCEPDAQHVVYMNIRRGTARRCECGNWFKIIDSGPDFF